jgi:RNA polymerase sigma-70 factor (ECF subfamily)
MEEKQRNWDEREDRWRSWMIAAQAGDAAAYEKLLLELLPYVRSQVARRINDRTVREDIVQNALISVHRARHTYRSERAFGPWLRAVVRNASIDWLRAQGRRSRHEVIRDAETMAQPSYETPLPGDDALSPEMEAALASLPSSQREAIELIHVEGLSVAESASRVGVSSGALKLRAHRGYRALRALLTRQDR